MSKGTPDCLTEQHLLFFGMVIHWFARHEVLIQEIMATISGSDVTSIKVLTSGLSLTGKRDALFNLLRHKEIPLDQIDQIQSYLGVLQTFIPLRNDIMHSVWVEGKPQNSIWPAWLKAGPLTAIKPMDHLSEDTKAFIEVEQDKVTYTLDNLKESIETLERNYAGFHEYAAEIGLISSTAV